MNPVSTPASEWSTETLAALEKGRANVDDTAGLSKLSGREQAAAQLAARVREQAQQTVDQQLAQTTVPVIPTREVVAVVEEPVIAVVEQPTPGLHSTAAGVPHATPISATAQTGGFTESSAPTLTAVPVAVIGGAPVAPPPGPPMEMLTTMVPGAGLKTVPDLSAAPVPSAADHLGSHNPFNPDHTPGFLDSQSRSMTGGTTPGDELPGGWGAVLKSQGAAAKPDTDTSLSEDVTAALHEVGRGAFAILPQSLVEKLSNHHQPGQTATTTGANLPSAAEVRETTGNVAASVGNTAANVGSQVYETTANVGSTVGNTAANVGSQVYDTTANVGSAVGNTAANVGSQVYDTTANVGSAVGNTAANVGSTVYDTTANVGSAVGNTAVNVGSTVYDTTANVGSAIVGTTANAAQTAGETAAQATTAVRETTTHAAETIAQAGHDLVEQARAALGSLHLPGFGAPVQESTQGVSGVRTETTTTSVRGTGQDVHQESVIDQAKHMAQELIGATQSKAEEAYAAVRGDTGAPTTGVTSSTDSAKSWRGTLEGYGERAATQVAEFGGHSTNPNVHNTSLPSEETTGAHPGDESEGVGALPGSKFATGVAVLPDEKKDVGDKTQDVDSSSTTRGVAQIRTLASSGNESTSTDAGFTSGSTKHEGYAPSGPAMGLSETPEYRQEQGHSHSHGDSSHRSVTEIIKAGANKHEHSAGYAPSGPAANLSGPISGSGVAETSRVTGESATHKGTYELAGFSGSSDQPKPSTTTDSASRSTFNDGYVASSSAAELSGSSPRDSTSRSGLTESSTYKPTYDFGGQSSTREQTETSTREGASSGSHTMSASSGITRPEHSSNTTSGFSSTTTTTHAPGAGSGPNYDLAPPLGVIVGSTPISSHVKTDQSHNPVLPGNIPAALPQEPVAVAAPSDSTTAGAPANVEHSRGPSFTDSIRDSKDSGVNTPGSTLESEQTNTTSSAAFNPALDATRFHAPKPDRLDSSASTTAIIHGKPGNAHHEKQLSAGSSLAAVTEKDLPEAPQPTAHVISSSSPTTHSLSTNTAPRAAGTTTGAAGGKDQTTANSEPHHTVKEEFAAVGHGTLDKPSSSVAAKQAPKTESSAVAGQGKGPMPGVAGADSLPSSHARTGSASSGNSKRSFLDKIKSKIHKH